MKRTNFIPAVRFLIVAALLFNVLPVCAEDDVQALKEQIEQLQKRVDELEAQKTNEESDDTFGLFNRRINRSWDPFEEMRRMQDEMDRMFQSSFGFMGDPKQGIFSNNMSFNYDFDMKETDQGYEIVLDMKGLDEKKMNIEVNEHSLTVKGEYARQDTEENENGYFSSSSYGSFMKTIPLPEDADMSKMKTEKKGDSLVITLPKKES